MKVKKAIIPAAGLGTRVLPASKAVPKEMLNIVDKPAIQYIVEEAVASGIPFLAVAFNCPVEGAYSYGTSNDGLGQFFGTFAAEAVAEEWDGKIDLIITANAYNAVPAMASRTDKAVETLIATPGYEYIADGQRH